MGYALARSRDRGTRVLREVAGTPYGADSTANPGGIAAGGRPSPFGALPSDLDADDIDVVETVGEEVAVIAAHLSAGMLPYLERVAWFDRAGGWEHGGHRTCAHWLSYWTRCDLVTARDHVRVARALTNLPEIRAALGRGAVSYSQVRAITRVATADNETDLLTLAEGATVRVLERAVRAYRKHERLDEAEEARRVYAERDWKVFPNPETGLHKGVGDFDAETAHVLMRATDAARDQLRRERWRAARDSRESCSGDPDATAVAGADSAADPTARAAAHSAGPSWLHDSRESSAEEAALRVDALRLVAERALQAGFGPDDPKTLSGTRADRYQVMLFVEPETLTKDTEPGMSEMEDGSRVSAETSRRIACDCSLVRIARDEDGEILNVGRRQRTVSSPLRRALEARDRGCRFPGCGLRFTDGHHIVHWADGGETSLGNTMLLCGFHHTLMHEGGWTVSWWGPERRGAAGAGRRAAFTDPRGQLHVGPPTKPPALAPDPMEKIVRANRAERRAEGPAGAHEADAAPAGSRWRYEREVPDDVWFRATEAALGT